MFKCLEVEEERVAHLRQRLRRARKLEDRSRERRRYGERASSVGAVRRRGVLEGEQEGFEGSSKTGD
ncbi:MAG: hypothetical protein RIB86_21985 [Imperialibacter sp.]|uniref:hypothetical protein n=1 Tax=Imperialibacter sp. TaxID=2038411 RepID=UPI0032EB54AF